AVEDVQVGAADSRVRNIDRHLAITGLARLLRDHFERPPPDVTRCAHAAPFARHDWSPESPFPPPAGTGTSERRRPCSFRSLQTAAGTPDRCRPTLRSICSGERAPTHTLTTAGCARGNARAAAGSEVPWRSQICAMRRARSTSA